uniref:Uncharacterized protein n=1 Tax=Oryza glumipatula TaxID=40148 RepID=A0A0E0B2G1_9ORYZ
MGSAAGAGASVAARVCRRPSMDDPYPGLDDPSGARSTWDLAARRCQGLRLAPLPAVASAAPRRKSAPGDGIAVMSLTEKTRSKPSGLPARSTPLCRANRRREIQFQYLAIFGFDEMMFSLSSGYPCYQPWQEALCSKENLSTTLMVKPTLATKVF